MGRDNLPITSMATSSKLQSYLQYFPPAGLSQESNVSISQKDNINDDFITNELEGDAYSLPKPTSIHGDVDKRDVRSQLLGQYNDMCNAVEISSRRTELLASIKDFFRTISAEANCTPRGATIPSKTKEKRVSLLLPSLRKRKTHGTKY